jgi:type II secretory ATPase GspE/PulE/Tfp pilus assembly ATPase PilB-like protein
MVLAQAAPAGGQIGPYALWMGWGWILLLAFAMGYWLYMTSWVCKDAVGLGLKYPEWTSIMVAAGGAMLVLTLLIHASLSFLMIIAVSVAFGFYVPVRNAVAPELYRVFDRPHVDRLLTRLRLKKRDEWAEPARGAQAKPGQPAAPTKKTSVRLLSNDGVGLTTLVASAPQFGEVSQAVTELLEEAVLSRALSLLFEPHPSQFMVKLRIDGVSHQLPGYDRETGRLVLGTIALLSGITKADGKQVGDAGAFTVVSEGGARTEVKVRAVKTATAPTLSLTFPDPTSDLYQEGLGKLGMLNTTVQAVRRLIKESPKGLIVFAGPPDSGKTTTLYASVGEIDVFLHTIVMLEESEEHELHDVGRYRLNPAAGETFQSQLTRALREDPQVVLVGEIKDQQTALLAVQAARERLVLAGLRAADGAAAASKLLGFGVPHKMLGGVGLAVLAQRLVRVLCEKCKVPFDPPPELLAKLKIDPSRAGNWFDSVGCDHCAQIGYRGRTGLFELLVFTPPMRQLFGGETPPGVEAIRRAARQAGMPGMQEDGIKKVLLGATTLKEVYRVTALKGAGAGGGGTTG